MFANGQLQKNTQSSTEQNTVHSPSRQQDAAKQGTDPTVLQRARVNPASLLASDILQLQKAIGNQAVIQLFGAQNQKTAGYDSGQQLTAEGKGPQQLPNHTGMPAELKSGLEAMSGLDMSDVRVHRNSHQPQQFGALAYTQGSHIYVGPGQDKHLAHEAWHVVQQKQGRVRPTLQSRGLQINDDHALEKESDLMGKKALQMKSSQQLHLDAVLTESLNSPAILPGTASTVLQARFWASDMSKPLTLNELIEKISVIYPQYAEKLAAFKGMELEEVDYILPANQEDFKSALDMWVDAYEKQDLINVTKMVSIINSIIKNGILNQADREDLLGDSQKAKTSTDDEKGSTKVHGIRIEQQDSQTNQEHAKYAQQESVNVLAEVKDDLIISGMKKRIKSGLLSKEERDFLIAEYMNMIDFMITQKFSGAQKLKEQLIENEDNTGFVKVEIGSGYALKGVLDFAMNKIANSERGRNDINKRMRSGFLSIVDSEKIPQEKWDMKPGPYGEGVISESIPSNLILKMILPKFLEEYSEQIINPNKIPIVYQDFELAESEIHLYSPSGGRTKLRNEINLMWQEQINEALKTHKEIFTHMTRGF